MPRSVYPPLLHMSFSPARIVGRPRTGRRTVETTTSPGLNPDARAADVRDDADVLVTEDQQLLAVGWFAEEAVSDFRVGRAQSHPEHFHGDLIRLHPRVRHVAHVDAAVLARPHDDRFHVRVPRGTDAPHPTRGARTDRLRDRRVPNGISDRSVGP